MLNIVNLDLNTNLVKRLQKCDITKSNKTKTHRREEEEENGTKYQTFVELQ